MTGVVGCFAEQACLHAIAHGVEGRALDDGTTPGLADIIEARGARYKKQPVDVASSCQPCRIRAGTGRSGAHGCDADEAPAQRAARCATGNEAHRGRHHGSHTPRRKDQPRGFDARRGSITFNENINDTERVLELKKVMEEYESYGRNARWQATQVKNEIEKLITTNIQKDNAGFKLLEKEYFELANNIGELEKYAMK